MKYIEDEPGDSTSSEWKEDAQVRSWLWNLIEPQISCDVMLLDTAYAVWKSIYETFASENNIQSLYDVCGRGVSLQIRYEITC